MYVCNRSHKCIKFKTGGERYYNIDGAAAATRCYCSEPTSAICKKHRVGFVMVPDLEILMICREIEQMEWNDLRREETIVFHERSIACQIKMEQILTSALSVALKNEGT